MLHVWCRAVVCRLCTAEHINPVGFSSPLPTSARGALVLLGWSRRSCPGRGRGSAGTSLPCSVLPAWSIDTSPCNDWKERCDSHGVSPHGERGGGRGGGIAQGLVRVMPPSPPRASGKAASMRLAPGKFPIRYGVSGLAAGKGDAAEKLLEKNKDF